jgi:hypothetical protein
VLEVDFDFRRHALMPFGTPLEDLRVPFCLPEYGVDSSREWMTPCTGVGDDMVYGGMDVNGKGGWQKRTRRSTLGTVKSHCISDRLQHPVNPLPRLDNINSNDRYHGRPAMRANEGKLGLR